MQTFLPFKEFHESAAVLDPKRLGNQFYREGMPLLRGKWAHHPASRMWLDYDCQYALGVYLLALHDQLEERGFSYPHHVREIKRRIGPRKNKSMPPWLGDHTFHAIHRGVLLYKRPDWYEQFGWPEYAIPPDPDSGSFPYFWPVQQK